MKKILFASIALLATALLSCCKSTQNTTNTGSAPFKTFAVFGNSISTYAGYIPDGYAIFYSSRHFEVGKTWWAQLDSISSMSCIANASWSGSTVARTSRAKEESYFTADNRIEALGRNGAPDVIFIIAGTNDWGAGECVMGEYASQDYDCNTFRGAYSLMLSKLRAKYPNTVLACCALVPRSAGLDKANRQGLTLREFNASIEHIAKQFGQPYVDIDQCGLHSNINGYTFDGLHPNAKGMKLMAECLNKWVEEQKK